MAQCIFCNRKGFLLSVDHNSVCDGCQLVYATLQRKQEIVIESFGIIESSKNWKTQRSRVELIESNLVEILPYEEKGLSGIFEKPIPMLLDDLDGVRVDICSKAAEQIFNDASQKLELAKTSKTKVAAANRGIVKLTEFQREAGTNPKIDQYITELHHLIYKSELGAFIEAAQKAEFKENYKKALDQYQEALYYVKTDEYDDSVQVDLISKLENKIDEMKSRLGTKGTKASKKIGHNP